MLEYRIADLDNNIISYIQTIFNSQLDITLTKMNHYCVIIKRVEVQTHLADVKDDLTSSRYTGEHETKSKIARME